MTTMKNKTKYLSGLIIIVFVFVSLAFSKEAGAFVGLSVGTSTRTLLTGENLFYGNIKSDSDAASNFLLFQKNASTNLFKVGSDGSAYFAGSLGVGMTAVNKLDVSGSIGLANNLYLPATSGTSTGIIYQNNAAFIHTRGTSNIWIGLNTNNDNPASPGSSNVAVGSGALKKINGGTSNMAIGASALAALTTGGSNVAIGAGAGQSIIGANDNMAIGAGALIADTSGYGNIAIGTSAGGGISTQIGNTIIGTYAGTAANHRQATIIGNYAGNASSGNYHIFVGNFAGAYETGTGKLIFDSFDRTNEATGRSSALLYGLMDATPTNQTLSLGGGGKISVGTTTVSGALAYFNNSNGAGTTIDAGNSKIQNVGTAASSSDAVNYSTLGTYVDGAFAATRTASLNMGGHDIVNVHKLTVDVIDPLYNIKGINYSTFAPSIAGGLKEEYVGQFKIDTYNPGFGYEGSIDFSDLKIGSDLWVWRQVVDFSPDNVQVLLTPYGSFAQTYYLIRDNKLIFRSDKPVSISYRLIGRRFDWRNWPTKALNQIEKANLVID